MINQQRIHWCKCQLAHIDAEVAELYREEYMVEANQLLEKRLEVAGYLERLNAGLIPNG